MVSVCQRRKRVHNTMVEVTSFNILLNSQTLGVLELVDSNDCICIVDIHNIDVVNWCILDNVGGRRLVWKRLTLQCKSHGDIGGGVGDLVS